MRFSYVGGSDGPTSVFLAGKVGTGFAMILAMAALVVIAAVIIFFVSRKK